MTFTKVIQMVRDLNYELDQMAIMNDLVLAPVHEPLHSDSPWCSMSHLLSDVVTEYIKFHFMEFL